MSTSRLSISSGMRWAGTSQAGRVALQFVGIVFLARLLTPADYGLMAMAATVTAFAALLRDMGTGAGLIHTKLLRHRLVNAVFWFNVALGLLLALAVAALASLAATAFEDPRLQPLLFTLAPLFPIASLGITHQSLLERESGFRTLAKIELTAGLFGLVAALLLAWRGAGVYALVAQGIVAAVSMTVLLWRSLNWRPTARPRWRELKRLFSYSGNLILFNIANYFQRNADTMLIGRFIGTAELGFYNIAYRVLLFPLQNMTFVVSRAMFPAYSRHQDGTHDIATHYLTTLGTIAFCTAPLMALAWALREPFIFVLLGPEWSTSANVLAWLAPVGFLQSIVSTSGVVLAAIGRTDILRNLGFVGVPLLVASFVAGLPWGITGVAAGYCVGNALWIYPVFRTVMSSLSRPFGDFVTSVRHPTLAGLATALAVFLLDSHLVMLSVAPISRLVAGSIAGGSLYLVLCQLLNPALLKQCIVALKSH